MYVEQRPQHGRGKIYLFGHQNFYLMAPLDRCNYMKMPIVLFLECIVKQYDLTKHVQNGFIYLKMGCAVWGLPQAGILLTNFFVNDCCHTGTKNAPTCPVYGNTKRDLFHSLWWLMILLSNMLEKNMSTI